MSRQIGMLLTPTLEECVKAAVDAGMPEREGHKLFTHYELCGWKYGKGKVKIAVASLALVVSGWKLRWEEKGCPDVNGQSKPNPNSGVVLMAKRDELNRILERMNILMKSRDYWRDADRENWNKLVKRKKDLMRDLGAEF